VPLSAPRPLGAEHRLEEFRCSAPELAKWLIDRALQNQTSRASRCFVVCDERRHVVAYYALAAGAVSHEQTPGRIRRNMPAPIPVIVLGRLAVHADWAGQGIGQGLLKDAVQRALQACEQIGARALLCHAIDDAAKAFYRKHGFIASPIDDMTVMLPLR
jgi:GNAT superfamily N-acetyltransferase